MNAQRFIASNSREAMAQAKAAFGDSAVILSSRSTEQGFEVVATAEEHLATLTTHQPPTAPVAGPRAERPAGMSLQQRAAQQLPPVSAGSSVAQDTETLAMSTLSFQDYVRERMLRKRREALQGTEAVACKPAARPVASAAPTRPVASPRNAPAAAPDDAMSLPFGRPTAAPAASKAKGAAVPETPAGARLAEQINGLKALMEERFNTLAWLGQAKQDPIQSNLMLKLIRSGYSPTVARAVMERLPEQYGAADAFRWVQEVLARNLKTTRDAGALCDEGGVFALIGSTGVGKTTTAAKLAAQCVKAYGANSVGLITLDTYRVAGYEQLRTYGRMLGVVAHLAHDRAALQDLLELLANKRMVIIDTAGLGQKDPRIQEMMELLASPSIKKLLVLNAGAHGDTLDEVFGAYKDSGLHGVVLSKVDEAAKLGPAVDALIRHQVVLRGLCTGQRVPEDWQRPDAAALVRMSMGSSGKSAQDPQASELALFFTDPVQPGVQLDAWHA
ncbi:flagellar biosynthesis protein FlhF [Macromonas nakdongensis]|uniref:flagellar biosynthesis protein FlhF n=1 Tax=Macromonas nakdongensis TaxID=1843082 RepID=UPI000C329295|nr:flagellar biosynthesis protein FlhF [Macromonas nakdongensis]